MRTFESGAKRDTDEGKLDYEGFLCPFVETRFAEYMNKHRVCADGSLRDSDNWQKGIPIPVYMKSLLRHTWELWRMHRDKFYNDKPHCKEEVLCAIKFNVNGLLHEMLKSHGQEVQQPEDDAIQGDNDSSPSGLPPQDKSPQDRQLVKRHIKQLI